MKPQSPDTDPRAERVQIAGIRGRTFAGQIQGVRSLNRLIAGLQAADIRCRHPQADEREIRLRLASRRLSAEALRRAFGWDPEREGY